MIQINPLKSYIDGGVRAALTTPPSASLVFDLPGKAIWVKGVKLKGTDHTYTFSHDNYITLTNTPDSNESEDIKIGVNTSALKSAIDTTYGVVSTTANGLAPKFTSGNKLAATAATTYYFLGWAGTTLKWYQTPFRNIRINSETTDCLGVNNTDPLIISSGNGISVTWDSTNKKIIITNTKPDVNHNTDTKVALSVTTLNKNYAIILKGNDSDEGSITTVNFSTYLKFNPSTKQLTINGNKVITTIDTFVGATTSADGSVGLVTKPLIANRLLFLRGDGTWATPVDTWRPVKVEGTEKLGSNALDLSAGNGISIIYNSDTKKIIITNTKPDVNHNTHYTTMLYIGENNDTKANKNVANPYLKLFDDNARRATFQIKAGNGIAVASDANGNITITNSSPDVNHNTDYKVTQSETTTADYRPLVIGYTSASTAGSGMTGNITNQVFVSNKFYVQPSTGNLYATTFVGALLGNASSATKLQIARTIWGQSFDGTGNIDGKLTLNYNNNNYPCGIEIFGTGEASVGMTINGVKGVIGRWGDTFNLWYNGNTRFTIKANGDVGIGTTSPSYKLHVAGDIYTTTGFKKNGSSDSYVLLGGGGHKALSEFNIHSHVSTASSWLDGLRYTRGALNINNATDGGSYWPWIRQTNTSSSKWFSVGTLGTSIYFIGSATSRTANSYDYGFVMNFSNGTFSSSGNIYAPHFYENSDIRYKKILNNLLINSNTIANLPLFDFEWIENNTIGTGTSAQAVQAILPNIVSGTDKLTLDYGILGTIAGITACKELVTLKSELLQLKEKVKLLEDKLRKYENTL